MKQPAVRRIDGSWNDRRNGRAQTLEMVNVERAKVVNFEIIQRTNASGRGN
jgi:predicted Fe-Mo cluster-binding NifX family protein